MVVDLCIRGCVMELGERGKGLQTMSVIAPGQTGFLLQAGRAVAHAALWSAVDFAKFGYTAAGKVVWYDGRAGCGSHARRKALEDGHGLGRKQVGAS